MSTTITVPTAIDDNPTEDWQAVRIAPLPRICAVCLETAKETYDVKRWVKVNGEKAKLIVPVPLCAEDYKTACWESPTELFVTRTFMAVGVLVGLGVAAYLFFDVFAATWLLRFTLSPLAFVGLSIGSYELAGLVVKPQFVNPKTKLARDAVRIGEYSDSQRRAQLLVANDAFAKKVLQAKPGKR